MNFGCDPLKAFGITCPSLEQIADYASTILTTPVYWGAIVTFLLVYTAAVLRSKTQKGVHVALLLVFPLIIFGRFAWWQCLELNPDEGFVGAAALALNRDPVYWRSIVGTTHGPLIHYILLIPSLFGLRIDFASLRFVGAFLLASSSYVTLAGLSRFVTKQALVFGSLPPLLFLATAPFFDFQAYNGEQPLIFVLALAFYLLCRLVTQPSNAQLSTLNAIGLIVGLVPLVKLQGAPAGMVIGFSAFAFYAFKKSFRAILTGAALSACAAALPLCVALSLAWQFDVFTELWNNAVLFNIFYVDRTHQSFLTKLQIALRIASSTDSARILIWNFTITIGWAFILSIFYATKKFTRETYLLGVSLAVLGASWIGVALPGNDFTHYVMLLTVPSMGFAVLAFNSLAEKSRGHALGKKLPVIVGAAIVYICGDAIYHLQEPTKGLFRKEFKAEKAANYHIALMTIASVSDANDSLLVWGWSDWLYVRSGLPPATKYSSIFLNIQPSALQPYFSNQYISQVQAELPAVMVEAVGPGLFFNAPKKTYGIHSMPELSDIINFHYTNRGNDGSLELLVRKKRIQRLYEMFGDEDVRDVLQKETTNTSTSEELRQHLKTALSDQNRTLTLNNIDSALSIAERRREITSRDLAYVRAKMLLALRARRSQKCLTDLGACAL
jgi:hypothetical protein